MSHDLRLENIWPALPLVVEVVCVSNSPISYWNFFCYILVFCERTKSTDTFGLVFDSTFPYDSSTYTYLLRYITIAVFNRSAVGHYCAYSIWIGEWLHNTIKYKVQKSLRLLRLKLIYVENSFALWFTTKIYFNATNTILQNMKFLSSYSKFYFHFNSSVPR